MDPTLRPSISVKVSEDERAHLREVFDLFDNDKNGTISIEELQRLMISLGHQAVSLPAARAYFKQVDKNNDGLISFDEFVSFMLQNTGIGIVPKTISEGELRKAFKAYDLDGDGYITPAELKAVAAATGDDLSDDDIANMVKQADTDGDGRVSWPEFRALMLA